jgi:hypothetical protein
MFRIVPITAAAFRKGQQLAATDIESFAPARTTFRLSFADRLAIVRHGRPRSGRIMRACIACWWRHELEAEFARGYQFSHALLAGRYLAGQCRSIRGSQAPTFRTPKGA